MNDYRMEEGRKEKDDKEYIRWTVEEDMKEVNEKREKEGSVQQSIEVFIQQSIRIDEWIESFISLLSTHILANPLKRVREKEW